jgi:ABC-type antimicrobial peptide transport system permease subunit
VLVCFALLGLFLAAIGLYGVIAHLVAQRTMEIGVRVALGAQARDVLWMILRAGLKLTLLGAGIGLLGSVGLGYGAAALMKQPPTLDPLMFCSMTGLLVFIGLLACWLPARRASKVDPMVALRAE